MSQQAQPAAARRMLAWPGILKHFVVLACSLPVAIESV